MRQIGHEVACAAETIISPSHRSIDKALMHRIDSALVAMTEAEQIAYLSEAVYQERLLPSKDGEEITARERDRVEGLSARPHRGSRGEADGHRTLGAVL